MRFLLDTNALIWWLRDDARLSTRVRHIIADQKSEILVSIISLWEVTMKWRAGKLGYSGGEFLRDLESEEIVPLGVFPEHLLALENLALHHKDPFDHLILAQAQCSQAVIITSDREMMNYGIPCISTG